MGTRMVYPKLEKYGWCSPARLEGAKREMNDPRPLGSRQAQRKCLEIMSMVWGFPLLARARLPRREGARAGTFNQPKSFNFITGPFGDLWGLAVFPKKKYCEGSGEEIVYDMGKRSRTSYEISSRGHSSSPSCVL